MSKDIFHERERAEEAAYFSQQDARLIEKLREKAKLTEIAHALAEKLKVDDPALLDRIIKLGVTIGTGAAFMLAPLIEIAWADESISEPEREVILNLASARGIDPGSADMNQILHWLVSRPSNLLFEAALDAIKVGLSVLPPNEADERVRTMIKSCEDVARAAGGLQKLLGMRGRVRPAERSVLDEIRMRLMNKPSS